MKIEVNEDSIRIIQAANNTIEGIVDHIKQNLQVLTNQQLNDLLTEITREVDTIEYKIANILQGIDSPPPEEGSGSDSD